MIELQLVRHGATEWNLAKRLQGQTDIDLSEVGAAQARALAPTFGKRPPELVVASTLKRTQQTAAELGVTVDYTDANLSEMRLGEWEGRHIPKLHAENPEQYWAWRSGVLTPPGGENFEQLCERVERALDGVLTRCEEAGHSRTLVVCHGGVLRASIKTLLGIDPGSLMPIDPGSLTIVQVAEREGGEAGDIGGQDTAGRAGIGGRIARLERLNWVPEL